LQINVNLRYLLFEYRVYQQTRLHMIIINYDQKDNFSLIFYINSHLKLLNKCQKVSKIAKKAEEALPSGQNPQKTRNAFNLALKIQCHVVKDTLFQTVFWWFCLLGWVKVRWNWITCYSIIITKFLVLGMFSLVNNGLTLRMITLP